VSYFSFPPMKELTEQRRSKFILKLKLLQNSLCFVFVTHSTHSDVVVRMFSVMYAGAVKNY